MALLRATFWTYQPEHETQDSGARPLSVETQTARRCYLWAVALCDAASELRRHPDLGQEPSADVRSMTSDHASAMIGSTRQVEIAYTERSWSRRERGSNAPNRLTEDGSERVSPDAG